MSISDLGQHAGDEVGTVIARGGCAKGSGPYWGFGSRKTRRGANPMRTAIEGHLAAARYEAGTGNHDVPPGNSLPFIVVCFNPPGKVETYEVLATNADL